MPETLTNLNILGYDKNPIKNTLFSMGPSTKIALFFPGIGYTCQMPVLYYATTVLLKKGYDVLWVEYDYMNERFDSCSDKEKVTWLNFDADAAYGAAISKEGKYKNVLLVGKSLGTFALLHLNKSKKINKTIWFTPLLKTASAVKVELFNDLIDVCRGGLFVIGKEDRHYDVTRIGALQNAGANFISIKRAGHNLEVEDDPYKSLEILAQLAKETEAYSD